MTSAALTGRKRFLLAATGVLGALRVGAAPARAAQFEYKLAHTVPVEHPQHIRLVQMWDAVKAETRGRLVVTTFPNGTLAGSNDIVGQLRLNAIQFAATASAGWSGIIPVVSIDALPLAFSSSQQAWHVMDGPLGAYVRDQFTSRGIFLFPKKYEFGVRQVTSSTKQITTLADMMGFKLLIPSATIFVEFWRALGAIPVTMGASEFYTAMQTHVVDGSDNPLLSIESFRWYEVQRYLSITNHSWSGSWLGANLDAWNALPSDIQGIVLRNQARYADLQRRDAVLQNDSLTDKLRRQGLALATVNTTSWRPRLGSYFAKWKSEFGTTAWGLLEAGVGRVG